MDAITDYLYLGSMAAASDRELLVRYEIKCVVNVTVGTPHYFSTDKEMAIEYHRCPYGITYYLNVSLEGLPTRMLLRS